MNKEQIEELAIKYAEEIYKEYFGKGTFEADTIVADKKRDCIQDFTAGYNAANEKIGKGAADEGKEAMAFAEWIDKMLSKRIIAVLKDSPRWFYNHKPNEKEGKQQWVAHNTPELYSIYKQSPK